VFCCWYFTGILHQIILRSEIKVKKKLLVFVTFIALAGNAFSQNAFDYLIDSLSAVLEFSSIIQVANYEYDGDRALWGTYLEAGKTCALNTSFDAGIEYLMYACADNPARNIDLKVYQGRGTGGTVVAKDIRPDSAPIVRFTPKVTGYHCFELVNSSDRPAFVSLVILKYNRNANFSFMTLLEALRNTLDLSEFLAMNLPANTSVPPNKWTLFGGNVSEGGYAGYYNTSLQNNGLYILAASGESAVNDCDVEMIEQYAYDNPDGRVVSRNTNTKLPLDYGVFTSNSSKYYNLKVHNRSSQKSKAFLFGFLIQVEQ
jgi:hypothetical protein